jgi:class 3 adenylate cyclase
LTYASTASTNSIRTNATTITGLPEKQEDHAERMIKFAHNMLTQLKQVLEKTIAPVLGSDSMKLAMRVGVNSGPVIAGGK